MEWVTIDFEASCLPRHGRSFPIEVGICGPLGTCSWLIKPSAEWRHWDWTDEAFALHGITRRQLDEEGLDPATVVAEVRRAIGPARVVSDSAVDSLWWQTLAEAAAAVPAGSVYARASDQVGYPSDSRAIASPLRIENTGEVFAELGASHEQILFAQRRADSLCPERHRAGSDARWLFALLITLEQRIAADRDAAARNPFPAWTKREAYTKSRRP